MDDNIFSRFWEFVSQDYYNSLWKLYTYFAIVLIGTWVPKLVISLIFQNKKRKLALTQSLLFQQMCICAFGEMEIFKEYGYTAFFIAIVFNMTISLLLNGKASNIFMIIEEFRMGIISKNNAALTIFSNLLSGVISTMVADSLFVMVKFYEKSKMNDLDCLLPNFTSNMPFIIFTELVGGFVFRAVLIRIYNDNYPRRIFLLPFVYAILFTSTLYFTGIPGLELSIAMSRVAGCMKNSDFFKFAIAFICTYVFPAIIGWWLHSKRVPKPAMMRSPWAALNDEERAVRRFPIGAAQLAAEILARRRGWRIEKVERKKRR